MRKIIKSVFIALALLDVLVFNNPTLNGFYDFYIEDLCDTHVHKLQD